MDDFPSRLKEAMRLRKYRQIDLANKTGIGRATISCYMSGKYKPKAKNVLSIAGVLNVSVPWLLGEDVPMEVDSTIDYYVAEEDKYIKIEYSDLVEKHITREYWCALYDEFDNLPEQSKTDILKYLYLVFTMDEMIRLQNKD